MRIEWYKLEWGARKKLATSWFLKWVEPWRVPQETGGDPFSTASVPHLTKAPAKFTPPDLRKQARAGIHACAHTCKHTHTHTHMFTRTFTHTFTNNGTPTHVCARERECVCVCVCVMNIANIHIEYIENRRHLTLCVHRILLLKTEFFAFFKTGFYLIGVRVLR